MLRFLLAFSITTRIKTVMKRIFCDGEMVTTSHHFFHTYPTRIRFGHGAVRYELSSVRWNRRWYLLLNWTSISIDSGLLLSALAAIATRAIHHEPSRAGYILAGARVATLFIG